MGDGMNLSHPEREVSQMAIVVKKEREEFKKGRDGEVVRLSVHCVGYTSLKMCLKDSFMIIGW